MTAYAPHRRRGFTLLELMVVIFIMLLMATLAVASIRQFLETERIRLAGGTVDSAIRLARQYAMSKRTQCMVEFASLESDAASNVSIFPEQITFVRDASPYFDQVQAAGAMAAKTSNLSTDQYNRRGFVRFDLSSLDVAGADSVVVSEALLKLNIATIGTAAGSIDIKSVPVDTWDQSTITWNTQPAAGGNLATIAVPAIGEYSVDVTSFIAAEFTGDKKASMRLSVPVVNSSVQHFGITATLEITRAVTMPPSAGTDLIPRQVRIIPYRRMLNRATGGFTWLLDRDVNALKTMELPKNIHFALVPGRVSVPQYDPVFTSINVNKIFFVLRPDGTCYGAAPEVEDDPVGTRDHWNHYTNTVILRDLANDDLCLLYTPPATSFTRQRYLFGGTEVNDWVAAHAPYTLW